MTQQKAGPAHSGDYRLEVEHFGPIAGASVDLRPLTVLIGPSNTGKSYLAILLYALHRSLSRMDALPSRHYLRSLRRTNPDRFDSVGKSLLSWMYAAEPNPSLPPEVAAFIRRNLGGDGTLAAAIADEIGRCFGVDPLRDLIQHPGSTKQATVSLSMPPESPSPSIGLQFVIGEKEHRLRETAWNPASIPAEEIGEIRGFHDRLADREDLDGEFLFPRLLARLSDFLLSQALEPVLQNAYYLPADRTGVMHSHQMVVSTLIQSATTAGLRGGMATPPILSGVLADFLEKLIQMGREDGRRRRRARTHLAAGLEQNILAGAVQVKQNEAGYPGFTYRPQDWENDLPLIRTSSMVSELAPVVLYLRHEVRPGDVLIIEEPEAHLHPAMQTALARELARMVRAGIRVVMTTHSEWLLEQIGNLVRLSNLPEDRRSGIKAGDVALDARQVGVWLFQTKERPGGSVVKELALDPETGLFPADFDRVSDELYNEGAAIFNRIQEAGE